MTDPNYFFAEKNCDLPLTLTLSSKVFYFRCEFVSGIIYAAYNEEFRSRHKLYLSILKTLGFGSNVMESRIHVEVSELLKQARLMEGRPFDPKDMIQRCVINVIIRSD